MNISYLVCDLGDMIIPVLYPGIVATDEEIVQLLPS